MNLAEIKAEIAECSQRMWQRGLVANHDGNISCKISSNLYLATPTSFSKKDVKAEDVLLVDDEGRVKEGKHKIFSEFSWHMHIYRARPDIQCVVHGHPVAATGMGLNYFEMGTPCLPEAIVSLGKNIRTLKLYSPLEIKLNERNASFEADLKEMLTESDAFLSVGNGVWTVGQNVMQTYLRLELVEQIAQATLYAKSLGGAKPLPRPLVEELFKKRSPVQKIENKTAPNETDTNYNLVKKIVESEVAKIIEKLNH